MKREGTLSELTDGKFYNSNDLVKLGCGDCEGCSSCCKGMGNSVVLDPSDAYRLAKGLCRTFESMTGAEVTLSVVDGLILPSLNMESQNETCPFLNREGRCSIHEFRPGICRLFPLGRYYEEDGFSYVLMTGECKKENRTKVKISKWLGITELKEYESFVLSWHTLLKKVQNVCGAAESEEQSMALRKRYSMLMLQLFYFAPYQENVSFYDQFRERLAVLSNMDEGKLLNL